ncbi:transposase [Amycolatopsis sp. cmx-4-68]|uniref:transposase n=1 Tax=Amycolatopsis sp. cmx-4-68 TaxID=2790938 RepID=UPI0039781957
MRWTWSQSSIFMSRRTLITVQASVSSAGLGTIRWPVERTIAWLKNFRRLRIRTELPADVHQAILSLACSVICLLELIPN